MFTLEVNKIALIADNDKRIQSINSIETYENGISRSIINKNGKINCKK